ncbi:tripartite tricarboxylate transporter TctB family protein [Rhodobacteraceae bacterium 2376]|uniref:Tripartite tricarboxylate transporter TctB family protein n=1 Tax=Rhabdonatronobacter sediminivivens TaxID=2743469 RepID=A0A7Z0KYZ7_9RHOB|nr:tripartite tricarboxylate transporter TctB family protein [Rhabdonatronobacter sediminivivens]NYS26167.1 tripartite tricarboxylate transporter TctB family protein [Rhabdonatronobacter sediminivivens]
MSHESSDPSAPPGAGGPVPDQPADGNGDGDGAHMVRADLLTGVILLVIGVAVAWASWEMPRLEVRRIHPATVPGLVPGLLGIALAICGAILAARSVRVAADGAGWRRFGATFLTTSAARVAATMVLALGYALVLVGWLPFWAASAAFVFAFIVLFERVFASSPHPLWRTVLTAGVQAIIVGVTVSVVFQTGFLVRLP